MEYKKPPKRQAGFTLIEILIAISLLAFITIGVVQITENSMQTMDRTTEVNKNNLQIETAMSRFEWDFSQIYSPLYYSTPINFNQNNQLGTTSTGGENNEGQGGNDPQINPYLQEYQQNLIARFERSEHFKNLSKEGVPIPVFYAPEKNIFEFFTTSNRRKRQNSRQSHFAWVRYALGDPLPKPDGVEENPNIPKSLKTLVRYFSADDPYGDKRLDPEDEERVKAAVLLENVESLEFQFYDYTRKKWETSLNTIRQGESLVRGIKIILVWYDSQGNKRSTERIFRSLWPMVTPQDAVDKPGGGTLGTMNSGAGSGNEGETETGED